MNLPKARSVGIHDGNLLSLAFEVVLTVAGLEGVFLLGHHPVIEFLKRR